MRVLAKDTKNTIDGPYSARLTGYGMNIKHCMDIRHCVDLKHCMDIRHCMDIYLGSYTISKLAKLL